jgi:YidC/Oxa1 family membrane protein insertase
LLVQIPIFILLYHVLIKLVSTEDFYATFLGIDLGGSVYSKIVEACAATTFGLTEEVVRGIEILKGLTPMDLGMTNVGYAVLNNPAGLLNFEYYLANLILLFTIGFLTWFQQKLTSHGNPQMAVMNVLMPLLLTWICFGLPGGVLLYWGTTSLLGVAQQLHTAKRTQKEMEEKPVVYKDKPMGNN